jgi:hypothetical protein
MKNIFNYSYSSSTNMFVVLSNVLKRCDLTINSSTPSSMMSISDDSITTVDWQEMAIFEKVTVLRALCDARLNRPDIEQVTEVRREIKQNQVLILSFFRICQQIHFVSNHLVKTHVEINYGILVIHDSIVVYGIKVLSKRLANFPH